MSRKSTQTMTVETDGEQPNDTPNVVAYRVGELEKITAIGLREVRDELVNLKNHFVTHADLEAVKTQHNIEHRSITDDISDLQNWNNWFVKIVLFAVIAAVIGTVIVVKP